MTQFKDGDVVIITNGRFKGQVGLVTSITDAGQVSVRWIGDNGQLYWYDLDPEVLEKQSESDGSV